MPYDRARHSDLHNTLQAALVRRTVATDSCPDSATVEGLLEFARGAIEDAVEQGKNSASYVLNAKHPGILEVVGEVAERLREEGLLVDVRLRESASGGGIDLVFDLVLAPLADEPVPDSSPEDLSVGPVLVLGAVGEDVFAQKICDYLRKEGWGVRLVTGFHVKRNSNVLLEGESDTSDVRSLYHCLVEEFGGRVHTSPAGKGSGLVVRVNW